MSTQTQRETRFVTPVSIRKTSTGLEIVDANGESLLASFKNPDHPQCEKQSIGFEEAVAHAINSYEPMLGALRVALAELNNLAATPQVIQARERVTEAIRLATE